jgi:hypothetical protein
MKRTVILALTLLLIAAVTAVIVRLRSTTAATAPLDTEGTLAGSLDTWPTVPVKNVA